MSFFTTIPLQPSAIFRGLALRAPSPILDALDQLERKVKMEDVTDYSDTSSEDSYDMVFKEEPLPSTVYFSPVRRTPTPPPPLIEDFGGNWTDDEPTHLAISSGSDDNKTMARQSSLPWEEHPVTAPSYLAADWDRRSFPTHTPNRILPPCLKPWCFVDWVKDWRNDRPYDSKGWIVPRDIFFPVSLQTIQNPNSIQGQFFGQAIISNTSNIPRHNPFLKRLSEDLFLHSRLSIPLVPTGEPLNTDPEFVAELVCEEKCQYFSFMIRGEGGERKLRIEVCIFDQEIQINAMVNPQHMNHPRNEAHYWDGDGRKGYWGTEC